MIPRYQLILLAVLIGASAAMGGVLWHLRQKAHQRLLAGEATTPTQAPQVAPVEQATLLVANDEQDTLDTRILSLPLPISPNERARAILGKLMELYTAAGSSHPIPAADTAITQVFLLPVKTINPNSKTSPANTGSAQESGPLLAVVNLTSAFASAHPAGIEAETLTILSICATLHANLPRVSEVRFLVDGQPRETLAGHADLTRTYLTADLTTSPIATTGVIR